MSKELLYQKIDFFFDENGKHLGKDSPRTITAGDCNCKGFYLLTTDTRGLCGDVPAVAVRRRLGRLAQDPYDDDGKPPTTLLTIALARMSIYGDIEIEGLERPNLVWAGRWRRPYTYGMKPKKDVLYLPEKNPNLPDDEEDPGDCHARTYVQLTRQYIHLY